MATLAVNGTSWAPRMLSILRIITGLLFMQHGMQKLFGLIGGQPVPVMSMPGIAGVLEFFGGLLIAIGLFTRPVAFILAGEMAVSYFLIHAPRGFWPVINKGELAVLYCFVFLYMAFAGGGPWSVDAIRRRPAI